MAAGRHATARTSLAATKAIRAARPTDRQAAALGSRPAGEVTIHRDAEGPYPQISGELFALRAMPA